MDIELQNIYKSYEAKQVLSNVSLCFAGGKIHALLGENGAGKSTLAKIISGTISPTSGQLLINGKPVNFSSPKDALNEGIAIVQQRPLLASTLTVKENIFLSDKDSEKSFLQRNIIPRKPSPELIELRNTYAPELQFEDFVKDLGGALRFYTAFLIALLKKPECLILDEPSAFLNMEERTRLYTSLKKLSENGMNIIVITHSPAEAEKYADTTFRLHEGNITETLPAPPSQAPVSCGTNENAETFFELSDCSCMPRTKSILLNASIICKRGELCAITGQRESAIDTLEDFVTGMNESRCSGTVKILSKENTLESVDAKKFNSRFLRKYNVAVVPSDKTFRASNPLLTVEQMLCSYYSGKKSYEFSEELIRKADVKIRPEQKCSALSGGMLQRLILERELALNPSLIIMCNPMQGLDTLSQSRLISRLVNLAKENKAVLLIGAEDFPLSLCERVYTLESGICRCVKGEM